MPSTALLFWSIGTIAETSDIQRRAYNRALSEAGLDWTWDRDTYARLLGQSGGRERLSLLARATGPSCRRRTSPRSMPGRRNWPARRSRRRRE